MSERFLPPLTVFIILGGALAAGPVFGIPASTCTVDAPIGTGQASVSLTELPDSAVLERSRFGAEKWRLRIDPAQVDIGSVTGRPTVTYKLRVEGDDLGLAAAATAILSKCTETSRLVIEDSQYPSHTLDQETYAGTITVTYRGSHRGDPIERELVSKNISVRVKR